MPVLRIKAGDNCVPVMLRHDVHWQQALPTLRSCGDASDGCGTPGIEVSAVQERHEVDHAGKRRPARMRRVRGALGRGGGVRKDLRRS